MGIVTALDAGFKPWVLCTSDWFAAKSGDPAVGGIAPRVTGGNGRIGSGRVYVPHDRRIGDDRSAPVYHGVSLVRPEPYGLMWVMRSDFGTSDLGTELLYQCKICENVFVADLMNQIRGGSGGAVLLTPSNVCRRCHAGISGRHKS